MAADENASAPMAIIHRPVRPVLLIKVMSLPLLLVVFSCSNAIQTEYIVARQKRNITISLFINTLSSRLLVLLWYVLNPGEFGLKRANKLILGFNTNACLGFGFII
jgi:hypothetical protein